MVETRAEPPPAGGSPGGAEAPAAAPQGRAGVLSRVPGWYIVLGLLTLAFQIYIRLDECAGAAGCSLSLAKAVVWSVVWPLSWQVYYWGTV